MPVSTTLSIVSVAALGAHLTFYPTINQVYTIQFADHAHTFQRRGVNRLFCRKHAQCNWQIETGPLLFFVRGGQVDCCSPERWMKPGVAQRGPYQTWSG